MCNVNSGHWNFDPSSKIINCQEAPLPYGDPKFFWLHNILNIGRSRKQFMTIKKGRFGSPLIAVFLL